jgi:Ala-tRNA(Pro) deacylase
MTCLDRLEGYLRENQVPFQRQPHHRAFTAQQVAASERIPDQIMAKVVMVFIDHTLAMLVVPTNAHLDLTHLATRLGAQSVRLATEREFAPLFPDCELGAMPPFGHLYGVPVYVDHALTEDREIVFQAGTHTDTIRMAYADYARLAGPLVRDLSAHPAHLPLAGRP